MRTTTQCPSCHATVSAGESHCWSCGAGLAATPSGKVPGPYTRSCHTCGRDVAIYHRICPTCGSDRPPSSIPVTPPKGWTETLLPNGAIRLTRTRAGRLNDLLTIAPLIIALLALGMGLQSWFPTPRPAPPPDWEGRPLFALAAVALVLAVAVWALWVRKGTEDWTIHPDSLEIKKECLGYRRSKTIVASELALETVHPVWSRRRTRSWRLVAQGKGSVRTLATSTSFGMANLYDLGAYLAARTGWRWNTPPDLPMDGLIGPWGW